MSNVLSRVERSIMIKYLQDNLPKIVIKAIGSDKTSEIDKYSFDGEVYSIVNTKEIIKYLSDPDSRGMWLCGSLLSVQMGGGSPSKDHARVVHRCFPLVYPRPSGCG